MTVVLPAPLVPISPYIDPLCTLMFMEKSYKLGSVDVKDITYTDSSSTLLDKILGQAFSNALGQAIINNLNSDSSTKVDSEYAALQKLMEENQTFTITYLTNVQK